MKNFLAPIANNKVLGKVTNEIGKFYVQHESAILTGGTIGFSLATTAVTIKNAGEINRILDETRAALANCNNQDEKNNVYEMTIKELVPLVTPIIIFQVATIGCSILNKKHSDKLETRLAETAGALSIAQAAVNQYQSFQKQTEEALGEKKYAKLQDDIYKNQEVDGRRFTYLPYEGAPGEILIIDKYSGRPFWCTIDRIENAVKEMCRRLGPNGGFEVQSINDVYNLINNRDLTETELSGRFGYVQDNDFIDEKNCETAVVPRFSDTHYIFPNGTRMPAFEMYLYPEPGCIDWGC